METGWRQPLRMRRRKFLAVLDPSSKYWPQRPPRFPAPGQAHRSIPRCCRRSGTSAEGATNPAHEPPDIEKMSEWRLRPAFHR